MGVLWQMSPYATSERGKESIQMFISVFGAIWSQRQMSILLQGFIGDVFEL
jgi:hypothetical protein